MSSSKLLTIEELERDREQQEHVRSLDITYLNSPRPSAESDTTLHTHKSGSGTSAQANRTR